MKTKTNIILLYFVYFIVMIQVTLAGLAYAETKYLPALATIFCALVTYGLAKEIRKKIGI